MLSEFCNVSVLVSFTHNWTDWSVFVLLHIAC